MIQKKWISFRVRRNQKSWNSICGLLLRVYKDVEYKWGLWGWLRRRAFRGSMAHDSYYTQTSCRLEDRRRFLPPIASPLRRLLNCWCTLSNWSLAISSSMIIDQPLQWPLLGPRPCRGQNESGILNFGCAASLPLVYMFIARFVLKIGQFFNPLPPPRWRVL